jgi:D-alanyl-D-alanine dipeptidase
VKIIEGQEPEELDMGTCFDFLDELSHTLNPLIQGQVRENRLFLKDIMERNGFINYSKEWWHFNIKEEPFPETYFDFPVDYPGICQKRANG